MNLPKYKKIPFVELLFLIFIGVGLFFFLKGADFQKFITMEKNIQYKFLLIAFAIIEVNIFLLSLRWYFLLIPIKRDISLKNIYRISISAIAVNSASPGKLGVPAKAFLLKKLENVEVNQAVPSLFGELFLDNTMLIVFMSVSVVLGGYLDVLRKFKNLILQDSNFKSFLIVFLILLLVAVSVIIVRKKLIELQFFKKIVRALYLTLAEKKVMLIVFLLTVVNLFISFLGDWFLFKGVGVNVPYTFVVFSSAIATFIGFVSPLAGGIGIREVVNAYLFKLYFNLGEVAFLTTILRRILTYISIAFVFIILNLLFGKITKAGVIKKKHLKMAEEN